MRSLRHLASAAAIGTAFAASLALPSSARAEVLELTTGELVAGKVASLDDAGVTFARESGTSMRVTWDLVAPRCRYDLWHASLAADDAEGRVRLGKWCLSQDMHRAARREILEAKGLGYAGTDDLDALLASVRKSEADAVLESVDLLVGRGDLDQALARVRTYLRAADPGTEAERVRGRVEDLVRRIERRDEEARQADEDRRKAEKQDKLKDWIVRNLKTADGLRDEGAAAAADAFAQIAKGNQTRARDALSLAEQRYQSARTTYVRVRKAAKEGEDAEHCVEQARECDQRTVEVLVRWGRLEVGNKSWKQASSIVDRGLKIDAVNRELLELRATIDQNWLRRKLSDVTNATGHASSF